MTVRSSCATSKADHQHMKKSMKTTTVFIAAPSDVEAERKVIQGVIDDWNLKHGLEINHCLRTADWKTAVHPAVGNRPQEFINQQAGSQAEIIIGMFWKRFGTPTGFFNSGTEEEIVRGSVLGRDVLVYFSTAAFDPLAMSADELRQAKAVIAFREKCRMHALYRTFDTAEELRKQFASDLQLLMRRRAQRVIPQRIKRLKRTARPAATTAGITAGRDVIGSTVAHTLNYTVKATKSRPVIAAPPGSIGANLNMRNYCQHLAKRYIEYRQKGAKHYGDGRTWHPSVIHRTVESRFGASTNLLPESKFDEVVDCLCGMIDNTIIGRRNRKDSIPNYSSFEQFCAKMA